MTCRVLASGLALVAAVALIACGEATVPASKTEDLPTRVVPTPVVQVGAPTPEPPRLDDRTRALREGDVTIRVLARSYHQFDVRQYALDRGVVAPACANFVMALAWEIVDPYPPGPVEVEFAILGPGGTRVLGRGASGTSSAGCGEMRITNLSSVEITVHLRYVFAELTQ